MTMFWGLRWWLLGLLIMLGSIINYLTRSTLVGAVAHRAGGAAHQRAKQYSWIMTAFQAPSCCSRSAATCLT